MDGPLDEQYLTWLYRQVASISLKNPARTYWSLARQLYTKEFVWLVPNDDNRVEDGRDLRYEFMRVCEIEHVPEEWLELGCSFLEMLIAVARRLSFESEGTPSEWFWHLLENLELSRVSDKVYSRHPNDTYDEIDVILDRVIWRTYNRDGLGGLFPLRAAADDQTQVEMWYQLSAYLLERL